MLIPTGSMAQHWQFKVAGGISKLVPNTDAVGAWSIGAGYEWEFDQNWTITPTLLYTLRGWEMPNEAVVMKDNNGAPLLNPETNLYEKMYNAEGVAIESVVGASGLYAQQITLKEGINNILVHATNGFDDEAIRLEINFLGESFLEKIKTFTVELTGGLANIIG
jgi:hypothetical protein